MTGIVDYGCGNLFSLVCSLERLGVESVVTGNAERLADCDRIILPGVGAFGDAADRLATHGLFYAVKRAGLLGIPVLGICLGMQLLFDKSEEFGEHSGLGLIPGTVKPLAGRIARGLKIPQMGWNALEKKRESRLFAHTNDGAYMYFVHSFAAYGCEVNTVATVDYGGTVTAAVELGNIFGVQFHPEKSGDAGLDLLRAFTEI